MTFTAKSKKILGILFIGSSFSNSMVFVYDKSVPSENLTVTLLLILSNYLLFCREVVL